MYIYYPAAAGNRRAAMAELSSAHRAESGWQLGCLTSLWSFPNSPDGWRNCFLVLSCRGPTMCRCLSAGATLPPQALPRGPLTSLGESLTLAHRDGASPSIPSPLPCSTTSSREWHPTTFAIFYLSEASLQSYLYSTGGDYDPHPSICFYWF